MEVISKSKKRMARRSERLNEKYNFQNSLKFKGI